MRITKLVNVLIRFPEVLIVLMSVSQKVVIWTRQITLYSLVTLNDPSMKTLRRLKKIFQDSAPSFPPGKKFVRNIYVSRNLMNYLQLAYTSKHSNLEYGRANFLNLYNVNVHIDPYRNKFDFGEIRKNEIIEDICSI